MELSDFIGICVGAGLAYFMIYLFGKDKDNE